VYVLPFQRVVNRRYLAFTIVGSVPNYTRTSVLRSIAILKNCRRAMATGGRLLIVEGVYPPRVDASDVSRGAPSNEVNMLVCSGGRQRSEHEFRSLCSGAGFEFSRIVPTRARAAVIEGRRA
jgi:hypothetical protein